MTIAIICKFLVCAPHFSRCLPFLRRSSSIPPPGGALLVLCRPLRRNRLIQSFFAATAIPPHLLPLGNFGRLSRPRSIGFNLLATFLRQDSTSDQFVELPLVAVKVRIPPVYVGQSDLHKYLYGEVRPDAQLEERSCCGERRHVAMLGVG